MKDDIAFLKKMFRERHNRTVYTVRDCVRSSKKGVYIRVLIPANIPITAAGGKTVRARKVLNISRITAHILDMEPCDVNALFCTSVGVDAGEYIVMRLSEKVLGDKYALNHETL